MPDDEQIAMVKRQAEVLIASLPTDDVGRNIIIASGGSQMDMTLDTASSIEYNKMDP